MAVDLRTVARLQALSLVELRQAQHALNELQAHLDHINTELHRTLDDLHTHKALLLHSARQGLAPPQLQLLENHLLILEAQIQTFQHQQDLALRRRDQAADHVQQKMHQLRQHERCREHLEKLQERLRQHQEDRHIDEISIRRFVIANLD